MFLSFLSCWRVGRTKFWILMIDFPIPSLIYSGISIHPQEPNFLYPVRYLSRGRSACSCRYYWNGFLEAPSGIVESITNLSNISQLFLPSYKFKVSYQNKSHLPYSPIQHIHINSPTSLIKIKLKMFNTFTAERNKKYEQQREDQFSKLAEWKKRYTTEVQPSLVSRYHRRINGFAKKMQDDPFVIKVIKDAPVDDALSRNYDKSLNISKTNFRFKSEEDWNSIYPPIERIERQDIMKSYLSSGKTNSILVLRNMGSQSKYGNFKVEYRSRCKRKQINPPMKYSNRNSQFMKQAYLPALHESKKRKTAPSVQNSGKKNLAISVVDSDNEKQAQNFTHLDIDSFSVQNSFGMRNKNPQTMNKTEKQLIEEEEMKALAQKKLYFKSLIDLEQNVKTAKERSNLKEILVKCGVFKPTSGKVYQEEEVDRFLEMMKTKQ